MEQSNLDLVFAREPWEAEAKVYLVDLERVWGIEPLEDGSNPARVLEWRVA